ncbi:MAG: L-threonylcarbamoyladenylate synthase [Syntrophomonadaceae bacterium]|jgi:L-threonylcarbamoyladenylate synthase|nr:L-threonylcarbamoyladenylate synthase [Bacillota bacterium]NLP23552.1 threonylcarbamoyl-AMP synthase [Syntrophomonadaceae bacterium]
METVYWQVDPDQPAAHIIEEAAALIRAGELVAFPTETVYGLGADAFSPTAVEKIYAAKNRPPMNPLLVHIARFDQIQQIAGQVPDTARLLIESFWPGPLSLILPAGPDVPDIITANRPGVGLRMPSHPVALALINRAGPLAAPSANLSGRPSPTTAQHVKDDLHGRIAAVLDAGATGLGIESTVLDLTGSQVRLVRSGGISRPQLESVLGQPIADSVAEPGQPAHYQTSSRVLLSDSITLLEKLVKQHLTQGKRVAVVHNNLSHLHKIDGVGTFMLNVDQSGSDVYHIIREAERQQIDVLIFAPIPSRADGLTTAVIDRICKASQEDPRR